MQEVQRFNKVLKSLVLLGDLILLNLLLWGFNLFLGTRFWCIHCGSIFQGMTLITLCYLLCNMHSGVILHRPVVRPEQIMIRVLCCTDNCHYQLPPNFPSLFGALSKKGRKCAQGSISWEP